MSKLNQLAVKITDNFISVKAVRRHMATLGHIADAMPRFPDLIEYGADNFSLTFNEPRENPVRRVRFTFSKLDAEAETLWLFFKSKYETGGAMQASGSGKKPSDVLVREAFEWLAAVEAGSCRANTAAIRARAAMDTGGG